MPASPWAWAAPRLSAGRPDESVSAFELVVVPGAADDVLAGVHPVEPVDQHPSGHLQEPVRVGLDRVDPVVGTGQVAAAAEDEAILDHGVAVGRAVRLRLEPTRYAVHPEHRLGSVTPLPRGGAEHVPAGRIRADDVAGAGLGVGRQWENGLGAVAQLRSHGLRDGKCCREKCGGGAERGQLSNHVSPPDGMTTTPQGAIPPAHQTPLWMKVAPCCS